MPPTIAQPLLDERDIIAWLCLCPLLAVASSWSIALVLAICLLVTIVLTAAALAALRRFIPHVLRLPLAALPAATLAVLEQLALAAWWPNLDAPVAPWLVLVAGLVVLLCCPDEVLRESRTLTPATLPEGKGFVHKMKLALALSAALFAIGIARDAFGRVFLVADTPVGALVLLALLLAGINSVMRSAGSPSQSATSSPLGPGPGSEALPGQALRRDDEQ